MYPASVNNCTCTPSTALTGQYVVLAVPNENEMVKPLHDYTTANATMSTTTRSRCPVWPSCLNSCRWNGIAVDLAKHLVEDHPDAVADDNSVEICLNKIIVNCCYMVKVNNETYIILVKFRRTERILKFKIMQLKDNSSYNTRPCLLTIQGENLPKSTRTIEIVDYNYHFIKKKNLGRTQIDFKSIRNNNSLFPISCKILLNYYNDEMSCNIFLNIGNNYIRRKLLKELECHLCKNLLSSPIYLCEKGHSLCKFCHFKLKANNENCPICRNCLTFAQNSIVENYVKQICSSCTNEDSGCSFYDFFENLIPHENICDIHLKRA